jgi:hypothetical protein
MDNLKFLALLANATGRKIVIEPMQSSSEDVLMKLDFETASDKPRVNDYVFCGKIDSGVEVFKSIYLQKKLYTDIYERNQTKTKKRKVK